MSMFDTAYPVRPARTMPRLADRTWFDHVDAGDLQIIGLEWRLTSPTGQRVEVEIFRPSAEVWLPYQPGMRWQTDITIHTTRGDSNSPAGWPLPW